MKSLNSPPTAVAKVAKGCLILFEESLKKIGYEPNK